MAIDQVLSHKIIIFLVKLVVFLAFSIPVNKLIDSMVIPIFRTIGVIDFVIVIVWIVYSIGGRKMFYRFKSFNN